MMDVPYQQIEWIPSQSYDRKYSEDVKSSRTESTVISYSTIKVNRTMKDKRSRRSLVYLCILVTMMSLRTTGFSCISSGQTLLKSVDTLFMLKISSRSTLMTERSFSSCGRKVCLAMKYDETKPYKKTDAGKSRNGPSRKASGVSSSSTSNDEKDKNHESSGVRLNKCLHELSRRGADDAITEGRVTINNVVATNGMRVQKRDVVRLDGKMQHWEGVAEAKKVAPSLALEDRSFLYLKYWKPRGVTCTSDMSDKTNIIKAGQFDLFPQRVFTIGRLDKDSTGLILLTSDGRVNQAMLSPSTKKEKVYKVQFDKAPTNAQIISLAEGVVITTIAQRDTRTGSSGSKSAIPLTAKTLPCKVFRIGGADSRNVEITLTEGRNRQIRKMAEALGLAVVNLHRTGFAGIGLKGLSEGNWAEFSEKEMELVQSALTGLSGSKSIKNEVEEEYE